MKFLEQSSYEMNLSPKRKDSSEYNWQIPLYHPQVVINIEMFNRRKSLKYFYML